MTVAVGRPPRADAPSGAVSARDDQSTMSRFRFRLQPALDRAHANETLARGLIVDARLACDKVASQLGAVESRLAEFRALATTIAGAGDAGSFAVAEAGSIALSGLYRERLREAQQAAAVLAQARCGYVRIASGRRALERLRERRFEEYRELRERAESAETDEMNCLRSNPGGSSALRTFAL